MMMVGTWHAFHSIEMLDGKLLCIRAAAHQFFLSSVFALDLRGFDAMKMRCIPALW